jgi:hypothetical protein
VSVGMQRMNVAEFLLARHSQSQNCAAATRSGRSRSHLRMVT